MEYQKHYNRLIERAKSRILEGYIEEHHIIPKCLNGSNDKSNLVKLTPEEHFVAHQLLIKIYPGVSGLVYGVRMMCFGGNRNNKWYGWLKRKYSESRINYRHTEETKKKISRARIDNPASNHTTSHSEETKKKISDSVKRTKTEEMNKAHSIKMSGRKLSEEHKQKIRESRMKNLLKEKE